MNVDDEVVSWAYRLILGREPEKEGLTQQIRNAADRGLSAHDLALRMFTSEEFRTKNPSIAPRISDVSRDKLREIQCDGFRFALFEGLPHGRQVVTDAIKQHLRPKGTFVDVGAGVGYLSMTAAAHVGSEGRVISVEPITDNVRVLMHNKAINGFDNITVQPFGVSSEMGMPPDLTADALWSSRIFPCVTLDQILDGIKRVDLIRIDIEGHEGHAILGAHLTISRHRPTIITEFFPSLYNRPSQTPEWFLNLLSKRGYKSWMIKPDGASVRTEANAILSYMKMNDWPRIDILWMP